MPSRTIILPVTDKVFNKSDILSLVQLIQGFYIQTEEQNSLRLNTQRFGARIYTDDGIMDSFDIQDIDQVSDLLDRKRIESIRIEYNDIENGHRIEVRLREGGISSNEVTIISTDRTWFNSRKSEIEEYLRTVKNQSRFYSKYRTLIQFIAENIAGIPFSILLIVFLNFVLTISNSGQNPSVNTSSSSIAVLLPAAFTLNYLFGVFASTKIFRQLDDLWPKIEFNLGPSHLNKRARIKSALKYGINVIILPLLLALIFEVIKNSINFSN